MHPKAFVDCMGINKVSREECLQVVTHFALYCTLVDKMYKAPLNTNMGYSDKLQHIIVWLDNSSKMYTKTKGG